MLCYMCGPHARSRVPPPSSSWYFTRYFLVAFLIPLQLRPGILKGIPDNKISFMPLSCQHCPTWYYYHYHLFNPCTYFCLLYAQILPSLTRSSPLPVWCSPEYPWVQPLPRRRHPQELGASRRLCLDRNCGGPECRQLCDGNTVITDCTAPTLGDVWTAPPEEDSIQSHISHGQF